MVVTSADELSNNAARILLSLWIQGRRTTTQVNAAVTNIKITQDDADFILAQPQNV